jgi:hypothetical protein
MSWFLRDPTVGVIERNENAWVDKAIKAQVLPIPGVEDQKKLEKHGVVFKAKLPKPFKYEESRFVAVDLPSGWKYKTGSPDRKNIDLVNSEGLTIAKLFIKMGGYDNFASIYVL